MQTELYAALSRLERQLHRARLRWGDADGCRGQYRLLDVIGTQEGIIQRELCLALDMRPSSVTDALRKLEIQGWIKRCPDAKDQRVQHVYLTDRGRAELLASQKRQTQQLVQLFSPLEPDEIKEFLRLAGKLASGLERADLAQREDGAPRRRHRGFGGWKGGCGWR